MVFFVVFVTFVIFVARRRRPAQSFCVCRY